MSDFVFAKPPPRTLEPFGPTASINQKKVTRLAKDFFLDGVQRARERRQRQDELDLQLQQARLQDLKLADPALQGPEGQNVRPQGGMLHARQEHVWSHSGKLEARYLRFLRTNESRSNYMTIKTIGKGAFGEVRLVRKRQTGKTYALKRLVKSEMVSRDQLPYVRSERDLMAEADSEWIVKLYTTFQDAQSLYLVMEFLPGGDLMGLLIKFNVFSEDITRFYMAEIVNAIEVIHNSGFMHRDVKPDNILLDRNGHIKLTDFGLSKSMRQTHSKQYYQELISGPAPQQLAPAQVQANRLSVNIDAISLTINNRAQINDWRQSRRLMAYSQVGTPDYMAPEVLLSMQGYDGYFPESDWWSVGAIMYECLVGWPPFVSEQPRDVYLKIINWPTTLGFPNDISLSAEAVHLIRSLMTHPEQRLGRHPGGAQQVKNHPWFAGVNFSTVRRVPAPFVPPLSSEIDTSCFPTDELSQGNDPTDEETNAATRETITPDMSLPFIGYTFKRFEYTYR
ncbi:kinase-like protein [Thozetella sp. PMI_491]|nr:kinase-like protein [Thozetella sp. PMI_491]